MNRLLVITDMQFQGSGYFSISVPLFTRLAEKYQIMIVGLGYEGEEHWWPFSILPCRDIKDLISIVHNLNVMDITSPDAIIVGLDIPQQIQFFSQFKGYAKPYIAITPLENPPLMLSWAAKLMELDYVFFISELGKLSAEKAGLKNAGHLQVGIDLDQWRLRSPDEKSAFRKGMDIAEDEFVILTVGENQERKNLSAALAITCELKRKGVKVRHIIVTRVESQFGWNLRDLAIVLGINREVMLMNKGMPQANLWSLYAMADCFLLTSKGEGLGLPVLESMACGLTFVGTDTGAIHELMTDDRGYLIGSEYSFTDVWGNSKRDMIDIMEAANILEAISLRGDTRWQAARKYVETRTWDETARQMDEQVSRLIEEYRVKREKELKDVEEKKQEVPAVEVYS